VWPSICERHVVGWQEASEAVVVNALQTERCDTAKRPYAAATKPVGTGAEDNGVVVARQGGTASTAYKYRQRMAIELLKPL